MQKIFRGKSGSSKYVHVFLGQMDSYMYLLTTCRKALLLGAGFVVKPTLTLLSEKGVEVTVGGNINQSFLFDQSDLISHRL